MPAKVWKNYEERKEKTFSSTYKIISPKHINCWKKQTINTDVGRSSIISVLSLFVLRFYGKVNPIGLLSAVSLPNYSYWAGLVL